MRKLLVVEDRFQISGRGLVVVPGPLMSEFKQGQSLEADLRKPDGTAVRAIVSLSDARWSPPPPPGSRRWIVLFPSLTKDDVPVGTEVWVED